MFFPFFRYGSDLLLVESYAENNFTAKLAQKSLGPVDRSNQKYWLGLASLDDLSTNTLESAAGILVSQYAGNIQNTYMYILYFVTVGRLYLNIRQKTKGSLNKFQLLFRK